MHDAGARYIILLYASDSRLHKCSRILYERAIASVAAWMECTQGQWHAGSVSQQCQQRKDRGLFSGNRLAQ